MSFYTDNSRIKDKKEDNTTSSSQPTQAANMNDPGPPQSVRRKTLSASSIRVMSVPPQSASDRTEDTIVETPKTPENHVVPLALQPENDEEIDTDDEDLVEKHRREQRRASIARGKQPELVTSTDDEDAYMADAEELADENELAEGDKHADEIQHKIPLLLDEESKKASDEQQDGTVTPGDPNAPEVLTPPKDLITPATWENLARDLATQTNRILPDVNDHCGDWKAVTEKLLSDLDLKQDRQVSIVTKIFIDDQGKQKMLHLIELGQEQAGIPELLTRPIMKFMHSCLAAKLQVSRPGTTASGRASIEAHKVVPQLPLAMFLKALGFEDRFRVTSKMPEGVPVPRAVMREMHEPICDYKDSWKLRVHDKRMMTAWKEHYCARPVLTFWGMGDRQKDEVFGKAAEEEIEREFYAGEESEQIDF